MPSNIARATALLLASFVSSVTSAAVPVEHLTPRVPWKDSGISSGKRDYPTGCSHGPSSRGCWEGEYDIDTDMDIHWPDTGVVRKVNQSQLCEKTVMANIIMKSTTSSLPMVLVHQMVSRDP